MAYLGTILAKWRGLDTLSKASSLFAMLFIALCALIGAGAVVVLAYLNYFIILIVVAAVGSVVLLLHGLDVLMQKIL